MGISKSNVVVGVSAAVAVTVLAPVLGPVFKAVGRPLAKSLLKGGLMLYERGREAAAVAGETVEDMVAELKAEDAAQGGAVPAGTAASANPDLSTEPLRASRAGMAAV